MNTETAKKIEAIVSGSKVRGYLEPQSAQVLGRFLEGKKDYVTLTFLS